MELESFEVVKQINEKEIGGHEGWKLLKKIKDIIRYTEWEVREANKCADSLASMADDMSSTLTIFDSVPNSLLLILLLCSSCSRLRPSIYSKISENISILGALHMF